MFVPYGIYFNNVYGKVYVGTGLFFSITPMNMKMINVIS